MFIMYPKSNLRIIIMDIVPDCILASSFFTLSYVL